MFSIDKPQIWQRSQPVECETLSSWPGDAPQNPGKIQNWRTDKRMDARTDGQTDVRTERQNIFDGTLLPYPGIYGYALKNHGKYMNEVLKSRGK